jgi:hypothetical protein
VQNFPSLKELRDELGLEGGRYDFVAQDIDRKQVAYQRAKQAKNEKECSVNKQVCSCELIASVIATECCPETGNALQNTGHFLSNTM